MHQTKKGNQYFFCYECAIGVDAELGLVHSLVGTVANVADVTQVHQLLHGEETYVFGGAGYTNVDKSPQHQDRKMIWSIAARPSSYKKNGRKSLIGCMRRKIEYAKAQVRAKVEHPFRVIKLRTDEKHRSVDHAVRSIKPLDGSKTVDGYGRGAPVMRFNLPETARSGKGAVN